MTPGASVKKTKTRLTAGLKGTAPVALTKTAKVGVALLAMSVVTVGVGVPRHAPAAGIRAPQAPRLSALHGDARAPGGARRPIPSVS